MFNSVSQDNPGAATSEALRRYRIGKEAQSSLALGVTERQLCVMTGYSIAAIRECVKVANMYQSDDVFLKAFLVHDIPVGVHHRTWGSFLASLGVNTFSKEEALAMLSAVKENVHRVVMASYGSADPDVAQETLGQIRAWLMLRMPPTIWSTIDRNFFKYQVCSYCGSDNGEPEQLELDGLLVCRCDTCRSEGVDINSVNWKLVAIAYASYANECNHTAEIYRTL